MKKRIFSFFLVAALLALLVTPLAGCGPDGELTPEQETAISEFVIERLSGLTGPEGPQGIQGEPGPQGGKGAPGITGPAGQGTTGSKGADGADGLPGPAGAVGLQGEPGLDGAPGAGYPGPVGATGAQGPAGTDGVDGTDGIDGAPGLPGADGIDGIDGADGLPGADGADGVADYRAGSGTLLTPAPSPLVVTFSTAFDNDQYSICATFGLMLGQTGTLKVTSKSASGFTIQCDTAAGTFDWIAIPYK